MKGEIMKNFDLIVALVGFIGLLTLSLSAFNDPLAKDMMSGVVVQFLFASLFIGGYVSYSIKKSK
jgi:predicted benzoate:H+ symporter BenE